MEDDSTKYPEKLIEMVKFNELQNHLEEFDKLSNLKKDMVRRKLKKIERKKKHEKK